MDGEVVSCYSVVVPVAYLVALVLGALLLGMFWARVAAYSSSSSLAGRYADVAASWWTINFSRRDEAKTLQSMAGAFGVPLQLVTEDAHLLVAACFSLASPKGISWMKRLASSTMSGHHRRPATGFELEFD